MVNLSAIQNIPPLELNTTILDNASTNLIPAMQTNANTTSDGYFALGVQLVFFLFLIIVLYREDKDIRLDIARTIMVSSGLTTILSVLMLALNFSSEIQSLLWFFLVFVLSALSMYHMKSNNIT